MKHQFVFAVAALMSVGVIAPSMAADKGYPDIKDPAVIDVSHADPATAAFLESFFAAKSGKDAKSLATHFDNTYSTYIDATLGWDNSGGAADFEKGFGGIMTNWADGLSYAVRIIGGPNSALVAFVDTPELFGGELRLLGAVDMKDGKIIRWVDYWDSLTYSTEAFAKMRVPDDKYPADFKESKSGENGTALINDVANKFHTAVAAGDTAGLGALLAYDAVYEDMSLQTQVLGRSFIEKYIGRISATAPFGKDSKLRHVVGGDLGGGFEWIGSASSGVPTGITALELDKHGKITRITTVYDARELQPATLSSLRSASAPAN